MTSRTRASLIITGIAVAVFVGLRMLPDTACGFLHLHDKPVVADGIEYCAPEEVAMFADPVALKFPVTAQLEPESPLVAGKPSRIRILLKEPGGRTILAHEIAISHTKPLHLLVADPTLDHYLHIHPEPEGTGGAWSFEFTPQSGGEHVFFLDAVHALTKRRQIMRASLPVEGPAALAEPLKSLVATDADGVALELIPSVPTPKSGATFGLTLRFKGKAGAPVSLRPVMAAYAHLVAFDTERKSYAHLHPMQSDHERDVVPELKFRLSADRPGRYRVWAQYDTGAGERFTPFDITVR